MAKSSGEKPLSPAQEKVYQRLKEVRASTTVSLKPIQLLRDRVVDLSGEEGDFQLRYYQVQGVFHMVALKRMVLGDDTGLGKTIESIAALCALWEKETDNKVIVISPKSAIQQWASEIRRFTNGVTPIVAGEDKMSGESPVEARTRSYARWLKTDRSVLIINYALLVRDWNHGGFQPPKKSGKLSKQPVKPGLLDEVTKRAGDLVVIFDEAHAFKSRRTKTWEISRFLSDRAHRVYGLTATLLKNRLEEGYCIYKVIKPDMFSTVTDFHDRYCYVQMQPVGRRKIPIVVGYKNLDKFRERIDPFFLGRKKHMVATELPSLTTKEIAFELNRAEDVKYGEALTGVLELGDGEIRDFEENKALVSLIYCQQVVNSLAMLKFNEGQEIGSSQFDFDIGDWDVHKVGTLSSKEDTLVDLLTGELDEQKVIVYTRFASLVPRLQAIFDKHKIKNTAITGRITSDKKRREAQELFQNPKGDTRVIFITEAGAQSINLQMAVATVFFDAPWSWGDYLQALGRMIRIGSPHQAVLAYHLMAMRPDRKDNKTIDHHVLKLLRKKKTVIDKVLGEGAVGALEFAKDGSGMQELLRMMQGKAT